MAHSPPTSIPAVSTVAACAGHVCDGCYRCRREGRCCHRDDPAYALPPFGSWDGPLYGEFGSLARDGDRIQCHACGRWFKAIGTHLVRVHDIDADQYRSIFGLRVATGLVGDAYREYLQVSAERNFQAFWGAPGDDQPTQLRGKARSHTLPLESKLDPANQQRWAEWGRRSGERERQLWATGQRVRPKPVNPAAAVAKAVTRWRELLSDPAYRAAHMRKIADARRRHFLCQVCGVEFVRREKWFGTRACGPECAHELRSRSARRARVSQRAEVRAQIRDRRRRAQPDGEYDRILRRLRTLSTEAWETFPRPHERSWCSTTASTARSPGLRRRSRSASGSAVESVRDRLKSRAVRRLLEDEQPEPAFARDAPS
jgi:hypothetical protein